MSQSILKKILGLLILCLVISVGANAGTIPINFAGGAGGTATVTGLGIFSLSGAPISAIEIGGVSGPISALLNITLGPGTFDGVDTFNYGAGGTLNVKFGGHDLLAGTFSAAALKLGLVSGGPAFESVLIGVLDPGTTNYFNELAGFNPFVDGGVVNLSLYLPSTNSLNGAALETAVVTDGTVPEPASLMLLGSGLMSVSMLRRFRIKR